MTVDVLRYSAFTDTPMAAIPQASFLTRAGSRRQRCRRSPPKSATPRRLF